MVVVQVMIVLPEAAGVARIKIITGARSNSLLCLRYALFPFECIGHAFV